MKKIALLAVALSMAFVTACSPYSGPTGLTDGERRRYEVTIFTDDPDTGHRVLAAIEALGYTHPENEVLDTPNDEYNVKWGMAPDAVIEELSSLVEPMVHRELQRLDIFGEGDHDIFINLPVCKMGGSWSPETCGSDETRHTDPQYDHQGIPQACGMDPADFGSIRVGSSVTIGHHREVSGDANWVADMDAFVGRTASITELFGVDGVGCPIVHVDVDGGDWFWRIRDMKLGGTIAPRPVSGAIPSHCGMTDENVQFGPVTVGSQLVLGQHTPWEGDPNWNDAMAVFVGQTARVTSLEGVDDMGCALIKVDADGGAWYWRVRDAKIVGAVAGGFPQHCGMTDENSEYGAAQIGSRVRLGRHRMVEGDDNWASDMEEWVGQVGTVTEHLGADDHGCPVLHVDVDGGSWAWRVRDLMAP